MLKRLPCVDDAKLASERSRELDIPRELAARLGRSAVEAARDGHYISASGRRVDWAEDVRKAIAAKRSIPPDERLLSSSPRTRFDETIVQVANETTLRASRQLTDRGLRPLALNFANGVNPGGGFLLGARAQEEALCRSSALYATLEGDPMYAHHRARKKPDSTDWVILSPDVPVFRDDAGANLEAPWRLAFLTSAAPYAPTVGIARSTELMETRILRVLEVARAHGFSALVLGAWGCGAFGNDPWAVAKRFRSALETELDGCFEHVTFAISDWSEDRRFLGPFRETFA